MNPFVRAFALAPVLMLAGCALGPRVVPVGPQTYSVSATDGLVSAPAREVVLSTADRYCSKRKLVMVPVSLDVHPGTNRDPLATADLVFRALKPGDPEIGRSQAVFRHHDPLVVRESVLKLPR
jgi:hypothetical protein